MKHAKLVGILTFCLLPCVFERAFAAPQDDQRVAARRSIEDADQLVAVATPESLREAATKYLTALQTWRSLRDPVEQGNVLVQLGFVYFRLGEYPSAIDYLNQALGVARLLRDPAAQGRILNQLGLAMANSGQSRQALDVYDEALEIFRGPDDRSWRATVLMNKGLALSGLGEDVKALEYYREALPAIDDVLQKASMLLNIGVSHHKIGEQNQAVDYCNQALALFRTGGYHDREPSALNCIGGGYADSGENLKALEYYNQAQAIADRFGDRPMRAMLLNNIGESQSHLGEQQAALESYGAALSVLRDPRDEGSAAIVLNNIGLVYQILGEVDRAVGYFNDALPALRAAGGAPLAKTLVNIAGTLQRHDPEKALATLDEALPLLHASTDRVGEAAALGNIGFMYLELKDRAKALDFLSQSLALRRVVVDRDGEAWTHNNIGDVYLKLDEDPKSAQEHFKQALSLFRLTGDRLGEATALGNIAACAWGLGDPKTAIDTEAEAVAIIESMRAKVTAPELRALYLSTVHGHYSSYIDMLMLLHQGDTSHGYDRRALEVSEQGRARSLLDLLAEAGGRIRAGIDPALLERERDVEQRLDAQTELQRKTGGSDTEVRALTAEYEQVEAEVRRTRYGALKQPQPIRVDRLQQLLEPDTVLLEYALGAERSYLWAVTRTDVQSYVLPKRKTIEDAATLLYDLLKLVDSRLRPHDFNAQYERAASALSDLILRPASDRIRTKRLIIVADGALNYIPFGALAAPRTAASSPAAARPFVPLIVEHEITDLPSASVAAELREIDRAPASRTLAVLADPVFSATDPRVKTAAKTQATLSVPPFWTFALKTAEDDTKAGDLKRLMGSRTEALAILRLVPPGQRKEALDFDASRSTATSGALAEYRFVHFATHGLFDARFPQLSGLALSLVDDHGQPLDGFLRLHDIFNLQLSAEMVVLSACQTALGQDVLGEGLVGVTRGFMYAGARRVVASLWEVDDEATVELMRRFYQGMLRKKLPPAAALRAAQLALWRQRRWHAAVFWAPFVLQGEWN